MKKSTQILITVGVLFFSQISNAQINLEHTFDGTVGHNGVFYTPSLGYYTYVNTATNQVRLYNEDYSLYKSITITPPANYSISNAYLFSKGIATTDEKITFFIDFINPDIVSTDPNSYHSLRLYDEDGKMVKDFGYAYIFSQNFHQVSNNKCRLSITRYKIPAPITYETEIYSLPGVFTGVKNIQQNNTSLLPYPNPANTIITLPYQLKQGETSAMRIYSINGQLIETKQIDFVFDKVLLNVSSYTKGMYLYEVNGISNRFIVD